MLIQHIICFNGCKLNCKEYGMNRTSRAQNQFFKSTRSSLFTSLHSRPAVGADEALVTEKFSRDPWFYASLLKHYNWDWRTAVKSTLPLCYSGFTKKLCSSTRTYWLHQIISSKTTIQLPQNWKLPLRHDFFTTLLLVHHVELWLSQRSLHCMMNMQTGERQKNK